MDSYFPKTRRPVISLKRPAPSITPPKPAKIPATPTTPKDARIVRPKQPPPVKKKPPIGDKRLVLGRELFKSVDPLKEEDLQVSPTKITSGPLKGVSTSLLDLIRAKEAAAKATTPEEERKRDLLGIAPEVARIVPTVFTASKREVLPYDRVVDKCFKGLKSNYTSETIVECLELMNKVAPLWISTVQISRGKFMKINRDRYTIPQLLEAIRRYKKDIGVS